MTNYLDLIGSTFSLVSTLLFSVASIWAWPTTLIACSLDAVLFWQKGIYGDAGLELFYISFSVYGAYQWLYGGDNDTGLPVSNAPKRLLLILLLIAGLAIPTLTIVLSTYFGSKVAYLDAITTIVSLEAMFLSCKKMIESWILWFSVDVIYIYLYTNKALPFHSMIYFIYLFIAIAGWLNWRRLQQQETNDFNSRLVADSH